MRLLLLDPHGLASSAWAIGSALRATIREAAHRTGAPVVLVAAAAMVLSWHVFRRTLRLLVQVALVTGLLVVATRLGWLSW